MRAVFHGVAAPTAEATPATTPIARSIRLLRPVLDLFRGRRGRAVGSYSFCPVLATRFNLCHYPAHENQFTTSTLASCRESRRSRACKGNRDRRIDPLPRRERRGAERADVGCDHSMDADQVITE